MENILLHIVFESLGLDRLEGDIYLELIRIEQFLYPSLQFSLVPIESGSTKLLKI
jgi:hypothetical protein